MKAPINYPCLLLERKDYINELTKNVNVVNLIKNKPFVILMREEDFNKKIKDFEEPIICHYYSVINEAVEFLNLKFCNRTKTYISI
jgi:hypothetical protein